MQEELAGGKINLKEGQELKLVTDYSFKARAGLFVARRAVLHNAVMSKFHETGKSVKVCGLTEIRHAHTRTASRHCQGDESTLAVSYQQLPTAVKPGIWVFSTAAAALVWGSLF